MRERFKAAITGEKVLAGLARGRRKAIEAAQARATERAALILTLAAAEIVAGKPTRGRPGRIARKLGDLSESQVRRILRGLSCVRDSVMQTRGKQEVPL